MLATARVRIRLSARERQIAHRRLQGASSKTIAYQLGISVGDVNARILGIVNKAQLASREEVNPWVLQRLECLDGELVEVGLHKAACPCSSPGCMAMRYATAAAQRELLLLQAA